MKKTMKQTLALAFLCLALTMIGSIQAQTAPTAPVNAFSTTTFNFNLSPITLPNLGSSISGAESDALFAFTTNNILGETTLIGQSTFIGGRYERLFPAVAKYLQNHTALTGGNFQAGFTSSLGVVKAAVKNEWGGRVGLFLRYAPGGTQNFNMAFEAQANYLPGYAGADSPHWVPSLAAGPNFRF
jgi:hypothetical protein